MYCLPAEMGVPTAKSPLRQLVIDIMHNEMMIIIRTSPGAAQLIARLLDSLGKADGVLVQLQVTTQFLSLLQRFLK